MITKLHLENFKGHRDTTIELPRFAMLVGDNGSGKTSVLEALQLPGRLIGTHGHRAIDSMRQGTRQMRLAFSQGAKVHSIEFSNEEQQWYLDSEVNEESERQTMTHPIADAPVLTQVIGAIGTAQLYRFRAEKVAAQAHSEFLDAEVASDGGLTPVVLADLKLGDDERFERIQAGMRAIVPSIQRIQIRPGMVQIEGRDALVRGSKLYFDFRGAKDVPAHHASQGTLVTLALLTVLHSKYRPAIILLDDFDHALHPRAQMELVRMIQQLLELPDFHDTQVIATTHSPYVLDELSPENVIAFALREDGSVASKPLSQHPDAAKSKGSLKAGELWTLSAERDWVL